MLTCRLVHCILVVLVLVGSTHTHPHLQCLGRFDQQRCHAIKQLLFAPPPQKKKTVVVVNKTMTDVYTHTHTHTHRPSRKKPNLLVNVLLLC